MGSTYYYTNGLQNLRTETYAPTRLTDAPSYAPTSDTYAPTTVPTCVEIKQCVGCTR